MVHKGRLIVGTGIILACAGGFLLSDRDMPAEYGKGTCYYLVFNKKQEIGAEWKKIDCDALEGLLGLHPETAYVDAKGAVHSTLDFSADGESDGEDDDSCPNPYDEGLSVGERIDRVACWYDLGPDFLQGLWEVESKRDHWDPGQEDGVRRSYAGAVGIAQVMPGTTGRSAVDGHELDIYGEVDNMELGTRVLLGKCRSAVAIANANGLETREASDEEPCGAVHYVCMGVWGNAWSAYGSRGGALVDEWYTTPEEVMARAYNGVSCGGNLAGLLGWQRGRAASYWTMHYVEHVLSEAGISEHSFDDAP